MMLLSAPVAPAPGASPPDEGVELVRAVVASEAGAERRFFRAYVRLVERVLINTIGPDDEIVDLIQDVFTEALAAIERLRDPGAVASWLTAIAVNRARSLIRKRARRAFFARALTWQSVPPHPAHAESTIESRAVLTAFYQAVDKLRADDRLVFCLRHVDNMSIDEIVSAVGTSPMTVKRRLARAETRFVRMASRHELLSRWIEGPRWKRRMNNA